MSITVQKKKFEIHNYDARIISMKQHIRQELSKNNSELILSYDKEMVKESLAKATRRKHLEVILIQTKMLGKDWKQASKGDIDELVYQVMQKYSDSGQETNCTADHKKILRLFYRWVKLESREHRLVGDPPETKFIRTKKIRNKIVREDLLTLDDLESLLRGCRGSLRDRALIHVQYEAGTRPGELLSLKIKHVKFDQHGAFIYVDGKTGARPVRIVSSVPTLAAWIDAHPFKDNPDSPLWIKGDKNHYGEAMNWATANKILKTVAQRSSLKKEINWKLFRHSSATESAKFLNETQMRIRHGWTPSSKMPAIYVHAVNADVDEEYLKHLGILKEEENKPNPIKICQICKIPNSSDSDICNKCGKPLDLKIALEIEEKDKERQEMLEDRIARQEQATRTILEKLEALQKS